MILVNKIDSSSMKREIARPFLQPVDLARDGCPTCPDVASGLMKLETIKSSWVAASARNA